MAAAPPTPAWFTTNYPRSTAASAELNESHANVDASIRTHFDRPDFGVVKKAAVTNWCIANGVDPTAHIATPEAQELLLTVVQLHDPQEFEALLQTCRTRFPCKDTAGPSAMSTSAMSANTQLGLIEALRGVGADDGSGRARQAVPGIPYLLPKNPCATEEPFLVHKFYDTLRQLDEKAVPMAITMQVTQMRSLMLAADHPLLDNAFDDMRALLTLAASYVKQSRAIPNELHQLVYSKIYDVISAKLSVKQRLDYWRKVSAQKRAGLRDAWGAYEAAKAEKRPRDDE
jgi:hypothetical protein